MKKMKLGMKLAIAFCALALIAVIIGAVGINGLNSLMRNLDEMKEALGEVLVGERGLVNRSMMRSDLRKSQYSFIDGALKKTDEGWKRYETLPKTVEEAKIWSEFKPLWKTWRAKHEYVRRLSEKKNELAAAGVELGDSRLTELDERAFTASLAARTDWLSLNKSLQSLIELNGKAALSEGKAADRTQASALATLIVAILIGKKWSPRDTAFKGPGHYRKKARK
ncbi:MAG TPA: hypothetical protein DD435_16855 [Cyanobacteria bacterium UBA8530]|nr:hypothetical protein [Cyanobacteria bacterium UBA8530]